MLIYTWKVKILKVDEKNNITRLQIKIHEGKNRRVRRMINSIDKNELGLVLTSYNQVCGVDVVVPKYINGVEVKYKFELI